jgi:hypothetical protein
MLDNLRMETTRYILGKRILPLLVSLMFKEITFENPICDTVENFLAAIERDLLRICGCHVSNVYIVMEDVGYFGGYRRPNCVVYHGVRILWDQRRGRL